MFLQIVPQRSTLLLLLSLLLQLVMLLVLTHRHAALTFQQRSKSYGHDQHRKLPCGELCTKGM
jgi:hypothetical protein